MQFWIESNILLVLKDAPFNKWDAQLVPDAGSCADCSKRTGHNKLLFGDDLGRQGDRCKLCGIAPTPLAIRRKYKPTSLRPSPLSLNWCRSAQLTVHRKKAARYSHATSTPPSGTISHSYHQMSPRRKSAILLVSSFCKFGTAHRSSHQRGQHADFCMRELALSWLRLTQIGSDYDRNVIGLRCTVHS